MSILEIENLTHIYSKKTPFEHIAIKDINLNIDKGEIVAIIGHTGSGKSTLIQHMNGLFKADRGTVYYNGSDIWENKKNIRNIRFKIGLCFQYPEYQLFEETVYKDIAFGPKNMGLSEDEIKKRVFTAAKYMEIPKEYLNMSPFDLSGGEKRRVAMAGILAVDPDILVLDEPTAGLDPKGRATLFSIITNYQKQTGKTVIFVSHSMEDVAKVAQRVVVIANGSIAMQGSVEEIFSKADELLEMGLSIPEITKVFIKLNENGHNFKLVYTVDDALNQLRSITEVRDNE